MLKEIFLHRLPTAAFFIALLAGVFWLDIAVIGADIGFTIFVMIMGAMVTLEFYRLCDGSRRTTEISQKTQDGIETAGNGNYTLFGRPMKSLGVSFTVLLIAVNWLTLAKGGGDWAAVRLPEHSMYLALVVMLLAVVFARAHRVKSRNEFGPVIPDIALTVLGILLGWFLCSFTLRLRHSGGGGETLRISGVAAHSGGWLETGQWLVISVMAVAKSVDIGGMIFGKLLGRHKLTPLVSPNKTWEGLAGGLALAFGIGWLLHLTPALDFLDLGEALLLCLVAGLGGFFGDLAGSLLKRSAGVKDSGNIIRGWGGVIDLVDSMLIAGPAVVVLLDIFSL